ncbi:MAG: OsmC family protein, partial [bacterium]
GMDVIAILRKRQLQPTLFEVVLKGIRRDNHPRTYQSVEVIYRASGPGITQEELERAAALSMNTYCSIFGMLKQVAEVSWRCEITEPAPLSSSISQQS